MLDGLPSDAHAPITALISVPCERNRVSEAPRALSGCLRVRRKQSLGDSFVLAESLCDFISGSSSGETPGWTCQFQPLLAGPCFRTHSPSTPGMSAGLTAACAPASHAETRASVSTFVQQCYCCRAFSASLLPLTGQRNPSPSLWSLCLALNALLNLLWTNIHGQSILFYDLFQPSHVHLRRFPFRGSRCAELSSFSLNWLLIGYFFSSLV